MKSESGHRKEEIENFRKIFDLYYDNIRSFVYFKTGDSDLAYDIVQETFLKLWNMRKSLKEKTVRGLLYTIAGNLTMNHFKHKKVEYDFIRKSSFVETSEPADFDIQTKEFDRLLQDTIAGIPEKNRIIFLMNRIDRLTYGEIAESLGLSIKAVEKRMSKALDYIRKRIDRKL